MTTLTLNFLRYNYESERIEDIIDAFDEKDEEAYQTLLKTFLSYTLDNEVLKLAQTLTSVGEWTKKPKQVPNQPEQSKQSYYPPANVPAPVVTTSSEESVKPANVAVQTKEEILPANSNITSVNDDDDDDEVPEL